MAERVNRAIAPRRTCPRWWLHGLTLCAVVQAGVSCSSAPNVTTSDIAASAVFTPAKPTSVAATEGTGTVEPTTVQPTSTEAPVTVSLPQVVVSGAAPAPMQPVLSPVLPREGQWTVLSSTHDGPVVWGTTIRPFVGRPTVVASYATFNQQRVRAALFNGTEIPGPGPWQNGPLVVPAAMSSLVAAFNGGFRFHDMRGGYFTEGRVVKPLLDGEATLAIDHAGRLDIGVYGKDLTNDGSWVSLRQNLPLIVDGGHEVVSSAHESGVASVYWGANYGGVMLDLRSALCQRADGLMMYAVVGKVDIHGLAAALVEAGCDRAMELDMNGTWPQFVSFGRPGGAHQSPVGLDPRMSHLNRYLTAGATKDFVALFDPALLPPNVVQ